MCGRYLIVQDEEYNEEIRKIINEISQKYKESEVVNGEAFPTNDVPVIYNFNGRNILSSAKWGFPNFKNNGVIINARAETIAEKPMLRKSFEAKRCIVPANGYYEWLKNGSKKTKYLINLKDKRLLYMAGVYNIFTDKTGKSYAGLTIITTNANQDVNFIHDRMPVILPDNKVDIWLNAKNQDIYLLKNMLTPMPLGYLNYKAIS